MNRSLEVCKSCDIPCHPDLQPLIPDLTHIPRKHENCTHWPCGTVRIKAGANLLNRSTVYRSEQIIRRNGHRVEMQLARCGAIDKFNFYHNSAGEIFSEQHHEFYEIGVQAKR